MIRAQIAAPAKRGIVPEVLGCDSTIESSSASGILIGSIEMMDQFVWHLHSSYCVDDVVRFAFNPPDSRSECQS